MSVWFGESFVISGFVVTFLQASTTLADISGSLPNSIPPLFTFGQEILSSMPETQERSNFFVTATYSSTVDPDTFAK